MQKARKPQFFDWGGKKVLAIYDGMSETNERAIVDESYDTLCLFYGDWTDLSYLAQVADKVRALDVKCAGLCDLEGLYGLSKLEYLRLEHVQPLAPRLGFDFSRFPALKSAYVEWRPAYSGLFSSRGLEQLTMWGYPCKDLAPFADAVLLRSLCLIGGALENVAGVAQLTRLENLELSRLRKLHDIDALSGTWLKSLHVDLCPALTNLAPALSLAFLDTLAYNGKIALPSLKLLMGLPKLREAIFNCAVGDQDFGSLFTLKHLALIRFIELADFQMTEVRLHELAKASDRKVKVELLGAGRKKPTVTLAFS